MQEFWYDLFVLAFLQFRLGYDDVKGKFLLSATFVFQPCEVNHLCVHRYMIKLWWYRDDLTLPYDNIWLYDCEGYGESWPLVGKLSANNNWWNLFVIVIFELVEGKYDPFNDAEMIFEDDVGGMPVSRMYWRWHHHCSEQCSHQLFICSSMRLEYRCKHFVRVYWRKVGLWSRLPMLTTLWIRESCLWMSFLTKTA